MNIAREIPLAFGVLDSRDPAILPAVSRAGIAASIWRRRREPGFAAWLDALPADQLPRLSLLASPDRVEQAVREASDRAGTPEGPHRDQLARDVAVLAEILSRTTGQILIKLRLEVVTDGMCRKFHMDMVRCRLLCGYRGAGTQYGAATPGGSHDPREIHQLGTGDVAIFRGALWPGPEFSGVLHRSPPMNRGDDIRLLLAIDPVDEVEGSC